MKKLFVFCGVPAMGKSTSSAIFAKKTGFTLINRDKVRNEIGEKKYTKEGHARVREAFHKRIIESLQAGETVIADATHLNKMSRKHMIHIAKENGAEPHAVYLNDTWENVKERNSKRPKSEKVPEDALLNMWNDYQIPSEAEGFKQVHKVELYKK